MTETNTPPWQQEHPDYDGWVSEYGGKNWGEAGEILHPPTEEGRHAAEEEGQEWQDYYTSKTDDEGYIETLYSGASPVDLGSELIMCQCCDWGYGWMGDPEGEG